MISLILLPRKIFLEMVSEANRMSPLETGGILLGTWPSINHSTITITHMIGPGPNAVHEQGSFEPDYKYHSADVERIYMGSPKEITYLGDWHSHPSGSARLSWQNGICLQKIAQNPKSCTLTPIMIIISGEDQWFPSAWVYGGYLRLGFDIGKVGHPANILLL